MLLETVSLFAYDRGELVHVYRRCVDQSPHPPDLHLLNDHHQEESEDGDDEQDCPEPEAKPWWSGAFRHCDLSIGGTGDGLNATERRAVR
jgi:hypothetical protein